MSLAIVPGSFDPMTLGHLEIVRRAAAEYDEVVVAVMVNRAKKYLFSIAERKEIAVRTVAELPNVRVVTDEGYLIDLFDRLHADAVCKGWRDERDLAYENEMAEWNLKHNPRFCTRLYASRGEHRTLSSTEVRECLAQGRSIAPFVHPSALPLIEGKRGVCSDATPKKR